MENTQIWICNKIIFKYVKSTVKLIFNKKLTKNDIYGSINSVQIYRSRLKKSAFTAESKKKKKKKAATRFAPRRGRKTQTEHTITPLLLFSRKSF